jgi:hypothetical protein
METVPDYDGPGKAGSFGKAMNKYKAPIQARTPIQGDGIKLSEHSDGVEIAIDIAGASSLSTMDVQVCVGGVPQTIKVVVAQ